MLPAFRYHPDPIATGSIRADKATVCASCAQARGYIYTGPIYGPSKLHDRLCPWCISSGSAAFKFDCFFVDDHPLKKARLSRPVILEVSRKTPGYTGWQQGDWQVCCDDACEFHGHETKRELTALAGENLARHLASWKWKPDYWRQFVEAYEPGGMLSVFRFVCRHCRMPRYELNFG
jgi:uncharacterized protein